jgi:ketosteroid isomerase-like protein
MRPSDVAAIEHVLATQVDAWNRGDLDRFMDGYARVDDLVLTAGGKVREGWDGVLADYRARYGVDASTMGHLTLAILSVRGVGGDGAVVLGRWAVDAIGGVFSVVFERRGEGWRIVHDHTSVDAG